MAEAEHNQPGARGAAAPPQPTALLGALLAIFTAAVVVGVLLRVTQGAKWAPLVGWLVGGAVLGAVVRRRAPALQTALFTTLGAGVVTSLISLLEHDPLPMSYREHIVVPPEPGVGQMGLATLTCSLACVVGAAAVAELYRYREQRRRPARAPASTGRG